MERPIAHTINAGNEWGLDTLDELATLLDMGADPNTPVEDGYPALHLAIVRSKPRHLALLLEKGADIRTRTDEGETLLALKATPWQLAKIKDFLTALGVTFEVR